VNGFSKNETTGRVTYGDGGGGTQLITLEHTRRGVSGRFAEPERLIRVSEPFRVAWTGIGSVAICVFNSGCYNATQKVSQPYIEWNLK